MEETAGTSPEFSVKGKSVEERIVQERKEKLIAFLKKKYDWIIYVLLAVVVFIAIKIRTANLPGLKDVTTGDWTLGPDLDPWLFWRWAKYIVENGSLMAVDYMRYVPLGYETRGELILHPYLIAWFHKILSVFSLSESVTYSAIIYPVFVFGLTVVAFFFFVREIFVEKEGQKIAGVIALVSSLFLSIFPVLLPRTISGIPEKEASAFLFMFLSFYLFLKAWKSLDKRGYLFAVLAGISTAAMALVWGGYIYLFITIASASLISYTLGNFDRKKTYVYGIWIVTSFLIMTSFSARYSIFKLLSSTVSGIGFFALFVFVFGQLTNRTNLRKKILKNYSDKISDNVFNIFFCVVVAVVLAVIVWGPGFIYGEILDLKGNLVTPIVDRHGVTVAENRQPYYTEWIGNFGPIFAGTPIIFWLFFAGSVYLFRDMLKALEKKDVRNLAISYAIFLAMIIFSRYSPSSALNGTNGLSLAFYAAGFILFGYSLAKYYIKYYLKDDNLLKEIEFSQILLLAFFFLSVVSARGAVRLIMILAIPASIMVSFLTVKISSEASKISFRSRGAIPALFTNTFKRPKFFVTV